MPDDVAVRRPAMFRPRRGVRVLLGTVLALGVLVSGCAQFPHEHSGQWTAQPSLKPQAGPQPKIPGEKPPAVGGAPPGAPQQPRECADSDPAVVATCLGPVGAIAVLPGGQAALVGERDTGRVLRVEHGKAPQPVATVPGKLSGLALSPSYREDELLYAYVDTGSGGEVVRVAPGDRPKSVLTGLPSGGGALARGAGDALLVATGSGGDQAAATSPRSPAGKVLRIGGLGQPAPGNPDPSSRVLASGLSEPTGICSTRSGSAHWVTDRGGDRDALYRIEPGRPVGAPAWNWPDKPGATGCVAAPNLLAVTMSNMNQVFTLHPGESGGFTGKPGTALVNTYGRFSTATLGPDGLIWLGTENKAGGRPGPTDDRVIRIEPPSAAGSGKD